MYKINIDLICFLFLAAVAPAPAPAPAPASPHELYAAIASGGADGGSADGSLLKVADVGYNSFLHVQTRTYTHKHAHSHMRTHTHAPAYLYYISAAADVAAGYNAFLHFHTRTYLARLRQYLGTRIHICIRERTHMHPLRSTLNRAHHKLFSQNPTISTLDGGDSDSERPR